MNREGREGRIIVITRRGQGKKIRKLFHQNVV